MSLDFPLPLKFWSPPKELRGGGQKNFGRFAPDLSPPPELNPVSAPVYMYAYFYLRYNSHYGVMSFYGQCETVS